MSLRMSANGRCAKSFATLRADAVGTPRKVSPAQFLKKPRWVRALTRSDNWWRARRAASRVAADGGTLRLVVIGTAQIVAALRADKLAAVSVEAVRAVGAVDGVML